MPEIHYTDALLTVIFAGGFTFMGWSINRFQKLDRHLVELEMRMAKLFNKANRKGAKQVEKKFKELSLEIKENSHVQRI